MARVKNPLPDLSDGEILKRVAYEYTRRAPQKREQGHFVDAAACLAVAARLRMIARRVPLWTDRKEISR